MVHCANVLDTVNAVATNASNQLSCDFWVSYCQKVLTIDHDMEMMLTEVNDHIHSDDFDALSVLCTVCGTLDLVVCLHASMKRSQPTVPLMEMCQISNLLLFRWLPKLCCSTHILHWTTTVSVWVSTSHVLTTTFGPVLAFAYTIFDNNADELFMEDSVWDSFLLTDCRATEVKIKDVLESLGPSPSAARLIPWPPLILQWKIHCWLHQFWKHVFLLILGFHFLFIVHCANCWWWFVC